MGSQWVEDNTIGNAFAGIFNPAGPGQVLNNIATAEAIKDARIKRAREQEIWDANKRASTSVDAAVPQAVAPQTKFTAADISNPAVLDAPLSKMGPENPDQMFIDPRNQAMAEAQRTLGVNSTSAALLKDPSDWAKQLSLNVVNAGGVPDTQAERSRLQFLTTGKFPTAEERAAPPAHNLAVIGPNGVPTGQVIATQNYRTDLQGKPIVVPPGHTVVATGPANQAADPTQQRNEYNALATKAANNIPLTTDEIQRAGILEDQLFKQEGSWQTSGGRATFVPTPRMLPPSSARLSALITAYRKGAHLSPQDAAATAAQPTSPDTAPATAPTQLAGNPAELRKEVMNTRAYDDWEVAVPMLNSAVDSAMHPTNQGDINIMYTFAKLMDPGSVVRDSEGRLVMTSGTIPQSIVGMFNKLVKGGGTMDPQVRLQLMDTLYSRVGEYKKARDVKDQFYQKVAADQGLDPAVVLPPSLQLSYNRDELVKALNQAQNKTKVPAVAPPPPVIQRGNSAFGVGQ